MAEKAYNEIKVTEEERAWAYHLSMDRAEIDYRNELLLGIEEASRKARENGLKEGKEEKAIESAKKMLADNLALEKIAQYTGLPLKKIEELAAEITAKS